MFKIAIFEDDIIHTQIIKNLTDQFFHTEYEVSTFPTGTEFLNSLKGNACPYDIIMMDIELGQNSLSGISLAEKINQMNPDSQIIFISQYLQYASAVYEAKHIYFVAETKGSMETFDLRGIEDAKIHCAREHFKAISGDDVYYDVVDSYQKLLEKVMQ